MVGEDVPAAVVDFATGTNATMIIVGVSRHSRLRRLFTGSTGDQIASLAGSIDVHLVTHEEASGRLRPERRLSPLSRRRQLLGWACAVVLPLLLTLVLDRLEDNQLPLAVQLFLAVAVLVALVGGMLPALVAAVGGFLLLNWFFTPPVGRWTIAEPTNLWPCSCTSPSRPAWPRSSTGPRAAPRRQPGPGPRRQRSPRCPSRC